MSHSATNGSPERGSEAQAETPVPDDVLLARLRARDEQAFAELVDRFHAPLLRLAPSFVQSRAAAEEVVQETWLGVINGSRATHYGLFPCGPTMAATQYREVKTPEGSCC